MDLPMDPRIRVLAIQATELRLMAEGMLEEKYVDMAHIIQAIPARIKVPVSSLGMC